MRAGPSPSETDIIKHIKFIAQDLFQEPLSRKLSPSKYSPYGTFAKTVARRFDPSDSIK